MTIKIAMIAAVGSNGVIGAGNAMPWRLPSDFAHFKRTTMGKPLIMGRKTFESIGKALPGRINIVVTRQKDYQPDGVLVIDSLDAAIDHARTIAEAEGVDEVFIGGGGELYREAMPLADRLYITEVDLAPQGDTVFPSIDHNVWVVVDEPEVPLTGKDTASFRVKVYERRA
ncbi:dihydrofolate reductase [Paradevosia shaoguanensis]|uniref:Dihydrofolate reductase n=1 Tax=Paradevosia shaoguanensis TaxID=1335043 RepID=A0AA41QMV6_9HYPH|nr:dihydrofolate reductase [Paradevosia shaoguanensis]MCF1743294.1 dihydrofolate reductase [Paradevosia shaoguanensis]MCI0127777.1 dihydrofolate reductase [Paradevosia shaoguanensis]